MASDGVESKMPGSNLRPGTVRELLDETAANLIEVAGVIKWFDVAKGYRFHHTRQRYAGRAAARDLPAPRRLPDRL